MINYQNVNENDNDRFNFVRIMNIQILNADYIVVKTIAEIPSSVGFFLRHNLTEPFSNDY